MPSSMPELLTTRTYLERAADSKPGRTALRFKREGVWQSWSFQELYRRAAEIAEVAGRDAGLRSGKHAALLAENGPEWVATYLGLSGFGVVVVHVDPKLREAEIAHILRDSQAAALFVGAPQAAVVADIASDLPDLRHVFVLPPDEPALPAPARPRWQLLEAFCRQRSEAALGPEGMFARHRPSPGDVASLIYTSGTTGLPKGAVLTHANFSADVEASLKVLSVRDDDDFLVVLPLHHAFGFMGNLLIPLATGCRASFVESLRTVGDNLRECSPTILLAVPLLIEKLYARMQAGIRASLVGRTLDTLGILGPLRKKVAVKLGGRLRLVISGGAPCPAHLITGLKRLGIGIIEGYGLTETAPVVTLSSPETHQPGTVGCTLPGVELRILEPNAEGIGEISVKGPIVMQGYFRHPEATAAVFDGDWFLTGDLGRVDAQGNVSITGRKKNVIVNREGKNIYPEEVEAVVNRHPWILESIVCGYRENGGVGERVGIIVVPDIEALAADREAASALRDATLLAKRMRETIRIACRELSEYKHPRRIQVRTEPFDKTPTQKIKRYLYHMDAEAV